MGSVLSSLTLRTRVSQGRATRFRESSRKPPYIMILLAAGPDGRFPRLHWKRRDAGRGKSELHRAVCRITSGRADSSPFDGKCHRKHTARIFTDVGKGEKVR